MSDHHGTGASTLSCCVPRRQFMAGIGALAAGVLSPHIDLAAQAGGGGRRIIDVHHHFTAPGWRAALTAANMLPSVRRDWTPATSIEAMDKAGVTVALISTGQAGWRLGKVADAETLRLTRDANEYGAKMVADYKGRFGLLAALPLPDVDATLKEIAYALDVLKADGFGITTSWNNKYLGEPVFAPVLAELNRRKTIVYSHPTDPACCGGLIPNLVPNTIEYGTDTTRNIMSLVVSGAAAKYTDIRFIFSHAGGTMPFLIERIIGKEEANNLAAPAKPNSRLYDLRRFYYDTAQTANPVAMNALKQVAGISQIVFGADYPYSTLVDHATALPKIFNPQEMRMIDHENAERIVPKYKT
jgi:predicted TIM-barrel fold metal-dependent hydrolase